MVESFWLKIERFSSLIVSVFKNCEKNYLRENIELYALFKSIVFKDDVFILLSPSAPYKALVPKTWIS